jgi:cytochrome c-type biogenesis protein CcmH/NrfG
VSDNTPQIETIESQNARLRARLAEVERERDRAITQNDAVFEGYRQQLLAEREKSRRLVECVRKIGKQWHSNGLEELLATVSDLIDEVKS